MPRRLPSRSATAVLLVSAPEPPRPNRTAAPTASLPLAHLPLAPLPLDDRSCPRREVAVLSEVDSGFHGGLDWGFHWDQA